MQHDGNIMAEIKDIEIYNKYRNYRSLRDKPYPLLLDTDELLQPLKFVLKWESEGRKPAAPSSAEKALIRHVQPAVIWVSFFQISSRTAENPFYSSSMVQTKFWLEKQV